MVRCTGVRKPDCKSPCQWIVGKGCKKQSVVGSPIQNKLLSGRDILTLEDILKYWDNIKVPPYWKGIDKPYRYTVKLYMKYLQEKYASTRGVKILSSDKFNRGNFVKLDKSIYLIHDFEENLKNYMKDKTVKLIVITLCINGPKAEDAHRVTFFINKVLRTVEYYDSNGYISYEENEYKYVKDGYKIFSNYLKGLSWLKRYNFLSIKDTNMEYGLQAYGDTLDEFVPEKYVEWGFCVVFSIIMIHYRIQYIDVPILTLENYLYNRIISPVKSAEDEDEVYKMVATFLLNYLMFMADKVTDPKFDLPKEYFEQVYPYSRRA